MVVFYADYCLYFPVKLLRGSHVFGVAVFKVSHLHYLEVVDLLNVALDLVVS